MTATPRDHRAGQSEGDARKGQAFDLLEARRECYVRRARRALLVHLLEHGTATADDVADAIGPAPAGLDPRYRGPVPGPLARAGIIRDSGRTERSSRPETHARRITVWELADRAAGLAWLAHNPELPEPPEPGDDEDGAGAPCQDPPTPPTPFSMSQATSF